MRLHCFTALLLIFFYQTSIKTPPLFVFTLKNIDFVEKIQNVLLLRTKLNKNRVKEVKSRECF